MYTIHRILCPTDFSSLSIDAIRYASLFVRKNNAKLVLMYVEEYEQTAPGSIHVSDDERKSRRATVEEFARRQFDVVIRELRLPPSSVETMLRFGTAYREIVLEAERSEYSAVVLSVQGMGYTTPHLMGRTAERIVRLCRTPVFTVRKAASSSTPGINKILVPTDFSEYSNYSIPYALSLARTFNSTVTLLYVTDLSLPEKEFSKITFPDLQLYHDQADSIKIQKLVSRDVEADNAIVNVAESNEFDLIVMGTHGARGMRRMQIGNTTEEVVRRVSVPVLSITHPIHKTIFPRRFNEHIPDGINLWRQTNE